MANLQSFPNNFGNLSKFSITSYDGAANNVTNTALSNIATSSDGSGGLTSTTSNRIDGLNVRNLRNLIGTSGTGLAENAGLDLMSSMGNLGLCLDN